MTPRHCIFVVGSQRSGTTLLGQVLGAHPQAVLIDENNTVYTLIETILSATGEEAHVLRQCLASARNQYVDDGRFTEQGTLRDSVTHLVFKAPNATYEYERLRTIHRARMHFVFVVRDVRDVVCSMQRLIHVPIVENQLKRIAGYEHLSRGFAADLAVIQSPDTADHIRKAMIWQIKTGLYAEFTRPPLNAFLVRYEDLVSDPDPWIARMLAHVDLSAHADATLRHEEVFQGLAPGFTVRTREIDKTSLHRWKRQLSPAQEQDIWQVAGDLMKQLAYPRNIPSESAPRQRISRESISRPVVAIGRGGRGTLLLSLALQEHGLFLGNRLNALEDSTEWADLIYELALRKLRNTLPSKAHWRQELIARAGHILGKNKWKETQPWGWKLPETMLILAEIAHAFSGARVIHLVQHPLDACLGRTGRTARMNYRVEEAAVLSAYRWLNWNQDPSDDTEQLRNAALWVFQVDHAVRFGRGLGAERYLEIKCEDLCAHPQATSDTIAAFLGKPAIVTALNPITDQSSAGDDERALELWAICEKTAKALGYRFPIR